MEKWRAIPEGYMRIGEAAKKVGVKVNVLRYYHKEGLLTPSAESEGGYRLYSDKDIAKLLQILMMKQLGFSLDEIKGWLDQFNTPKDVMKMLAEQSSRVHKKIEMLSESLNVMEMLNAEVAQMEVVNFKKYADILLNLYIKNERYWMIKHFDDEALELFGERIGHEKVALMTASLNDLLKEAIMLVKERLSPESEKGQQYAAKFWETLMEFSGGDPEMMFKLNEQIEKASSHNKEFEDERKLARKFIQQALEVYCEKFKI
ncbi:MAG: MerR family transcriptional regulator [Defluviitaleaceae bacterium]|nr:MerR family transcriptional regulator [Defluviitaleaceae bacterium]